jgi:hypothetical protein
MDKSIIYYTDNTLAEPLFSVVQKHLLAAGLPIYSCSLEPLDFGDNQVVEGERGYPTMVRQIINCLERSPSKYVFFVEHDVLYPVCHFDFEPERDDIFYYNENVLRWMMGDDHLIGYDRLLCLSTMCVNREFALNHYRARWEKIVVKGWDQLNKGEPQWARIMGYEPGTKKTSRGGFSDDDYATWKSLLPVIDVRHKGTYSQPKTKLRNFKHPPTNWREVPVKNLIGWNLKEELK